MKRGDGYNEALSLWDIQESLLQSYRSIFITAQSVVFAIAAAVATLAPCSAIILSLLGGILMFIWQSVTSNRARDVSFVQWLLLQAEEGQDITSPVTKFKKFQGEEVITVGDKTVWRDTRKQIDNLVNDLPYINLGKSPSRKKMEFWLPWFFWVLWILVIYISIKHTDLPLQEFIELCIQTGQATEK